MPFFTVIIPLYNKEDYIKDCLKSVLNQSFKDYEIIVINDGSTDDSLKILETIKTDKLTIFSQKNKGLSATRNKGFSLAKGNVVAFLDADDYWLPTFLGTIKSLYDNFPEAKIYGSSYYERNYKQNFNINVNIDDNLKNTSFTINDFFKANIKQFIPCQSTIGLKKESFPSTLFKENITYHEDVDFYLNYCTKYKVAICYSPLALINFSSNNRMSQSSLSDKTLPDLNYYQTLHSNNKSIRKYIDVQRYKYIIKCELENNAQLKRSFLNEINTKNLTYTQKLMIKIPRKMLFFLQAIKKLFLKNKIRLTTS